MSYQQPLASCLCLLTLLVGTVKPARAASEFDDFLKPLFAENCARCHGGKKLKGKVNLKEITSAEQFLASPELIAKLVDVIDADEMPPEDEPPLAEGDRARLLASLRRILAESVAAAAPAPVQIRRLNRFQYNNSLRDLFQLQRDVFGLSEKLMTRHGDYLSAQPGNMPEKVEVACRSLDPTPGLADVAPFPKDLRAAHGFDNQANQLTLSPLLLDAFLKLSVSILESPDFNAQTVGIWDEFFTEPAAAGNLEPEVRRRLEKFLQQAFRGPVERETTDRYTAYALAKIKQGMPFTDSMKKVASAAMSSPMFLFRHGPVAGGGEQPFELASKLAFFLWGSGPDPELLRLAENGELLKPDVLRQTIDRMIADPKIERFLDSFPSQWMQLENALAATPDPQKAKFFNLDKDRPASTQMVLEPLLLFDAVFLEDRPIIELIKPTFGYQSEFLKSWYSNDLEPPKLDAAKIAEENRARDERRRELAASIALARSGLAAIDAPARATLLAARKQDGGASEPVDLKPYAAWEFDGNLDDSVNALGLEAHGTVRFQDGMVVLENDAFLQSGKLPIGLKAKTLEVWCQLPDIDRRGGGVMGIQGPGDFFDTIVIGERQPRHWISGSNGFSRTEDFPGSAPEERAGELLHLAMVYEADGTTTLFRNGKPYGKPFRKGAATFPKDQTSVIFGLRHLPPGGNKHLPVSIGRARLYDRALTPAEVAASSEGADYITDKELIAALTPDQKGQRDALLRSLAEAEVALGAIPANIDPKKAEQDLSREFENQLRSRLRSQQFERVAATDPRYGGVITNAAMLSMTSGPDRTHPIARGAWIIEVIFNDPPPPPPNDVPPLSEESTSKNLTIREKFAAHRANPDCAGCHSRLDPLGFAMENFDITGRWRDKYENGRDVDASGTLMKKYPFDGIVRFKQALVDEERRFAKAFAAHLLRFALARELGPADSLTLDAIIRRAEGDGFRLQSLIREIVLSDPFLGKDDRSTH